jgi:hypothetical protein
LATPVKHVGITLKILIPFGSRIGAFERHFYNPGLLSLGTIERVYDLDASVGEFLAARNGTVDIRTTTWPKAA